MSHFLALRDRRLYLIFLCSKLFISCATSHRFFRETRSCIINRSYLLTQPFAYILTHIYYSFVPHLCCPSFNHWPMRNKVRFECFMLSDEELKESVKSFYTPKTWPPTVKNLLNGWKVETSAFQMNLYLRTCWLVPIWTSLHLAVSICGGNPKCEG